MCRYNSILTILLHLLQDICDDENAYLNLLDFSTPADLLSGTRRSPLCLPSDTELSARNAAAEHIRCAETVLDQESLTASEPFHLLMLNLTYRALPAGDALRLWIRRMYRGSSCVRGPMEELKDGGGGGGVEVAPPPPLHWKGFYLPLTEE